MADSRGNGPSGATWGDGRPLPEPVEHGRDRTAVRLEPVAQGRDLLVLVTGGEAHVGAVAVCGASLEGKPFEPVVTVVPGHKEGPVAEECAKRLAGAAGCTCAVVAGIHQDDATPGEIAAIVANVRLGVAELVESLTENP